MSIDLMKKWFHTKKKGRNKRNQGETIADEDYADDPALLACTPAQAESQLRDLEQAARDAGLYMNFT